MQLTNIAEQNRLLTKIGVSLLEKLLSIYSCDFYRFARQSFSSVLWSREIN